MEKPKNLSPHVSDHLANERTFLAWLRTSFSLLTLGFAANKFAQFLSELRAKSQKEPPRFLLGSERVGLVMVITGTVLVGLSWWNYQRTRRGIDSGSYLPHALLVSVLSFFSLLFGITVVGLLLQG